MNDPWKHRSKGMKCATCMWFVEKDGSAIGRCRRHSPTMSGYPVVYHNDWCGDHKLDSEKTHHEKTQEVSCHISGPVCSPHIPGLAIRK